ncbi:hypothetical protein [Terriglobus albidus]|uniref:hypothetical protein n=1 Tax=Terriglobus albidus TaxID=1592106 RepID=UPI0021DFD96F|nr:hypothetical protein [Terriglobus albidus]
MSRSESPTTRPGYLNRNKQRVIGKAAWVDSNAPNQNTYKLRCEWQGCGFEYGADGIDIHKRKCPRCQDGKPGQPAPETLPTLF